ncbi:MAG: hypothetical protein M1602_06670, partial [Firmicutes bacterium]|nr:hypothetical protein [Bacillota bacterium]
MIGGQGRTNAQDRREVSPTSENLHPAFHEEKANLEDTIRLVKTEAARLRQLKFDPKVHSTEDAIIIDEWKRYGWQLEAVLDRPYFGRIDIRDPHDPRDLSDGGLQKLYIGTVPVYADKTRLHKTDGRSHPRAKICTPPSTRRRPTWRTPSGWSRQRLRAFASS